MGGQACVVYGGAEFSRDTDLAVLAETANLQRLRRALDELQAECVAVPPFERAYLEMGLAVHFRCRHPDAESMRIDVMSRMRGVEAFPALWDRRTTIDLGGESIDLLSLPDLVKAKKTQRDKDWPMITRLLEASYFTTRGTPTATQVDFWLRELRTPAILASVAARFPAERERIAPERPLLRLAAAGASDLLAAALLEEQNREREADRAYWQPLKEELGRLRRQRRE